MRRRVPALALLLLGCGCSGGQKWADLGDLETSGGVLRGCRMGYRTYGRLDARGSNAVLLLPWFQGTSGQLGSEVGSSRVVDDDTFFVIAVDPPGNGVSCSPSNSKLQPGAAFPRLGMADIVQAERRLLTDVLGIRHLRAVVGKSMGGMQALAWAAMEPGFMDAAVAAGGSPLSTERDRRYWEGAAGQVRGSTRWQRATAALGRLAPVQAVRELRTNPEDYVLQAEVIRTLDVPSLVGAGTLEQLAPRLRSRLLVVVPERDEVVDPGPARELARLTGAEVLVVDGTCGHDALKCERGRIDAAIRRFLEATPR
jgi:homoserine O-acetyltransferase